MKISSTELSSFIGDVRPIWMIGDDVEQYSPIYWRTEGDAVKIHSFNGCDHSTFNYGVLVNFVKEGEATVIAKCEGVEYRCVVTSKKRRDFSGQTLNFYKGDLHTHTSPEHTHDRFLNRTENKLPDYFNYLKKENLRDLAVITDHSSTTNYMDFFAGFTEYELRKDDMEPIVYAGCENEVMYTEEDRFGRTHRRSGELVVINANSFCQSNTYEEFLWAFKDSPFAIGVFAHPHVLGYSTKGVWDFRLRTNNSKAMRSLFKYVEVLGNPRKENMLHEYVYSEALDGGYRISAVCSSDQHGPGCVWDFSSYPGATIIMAPEKTKEAFTDALLNLRAYACESGNIKLLYSVNGKPAPCDLEMTDKYHFEVKIDYFYEDKATRPIRCEVISDGGVTLKTIENVNFESFEFDIESDSARWFYLKLVDSNTKRTFSPPVFTGRPVIPYVTDDLSPIDKSGFKITSSDGTDAGALIDDDTFSSWKSKTTSCELVIDMGKAQEVSALGNYAPFAVAPTPPPPDVGMVQAYMEGIFARDYVISTSLDGVNYNVVAKGIFRAFAGEEIVRFAKHNARFVKFEVLTTTGQNLGRAPYNSLGVELCELSLFE